MRSIFNVSPVVRAVGVIGAVSVLATSVTYAALQSTATLADNSVESKTAGLVLDSKASGAYDGLFNTSEAGFNFTGIVPGVTDSSVGSFKLRNNGTTALDVKVAVPTAPTLSAGLTAAQVTFTFTPAGGGAAVVKTLADLEAVGGAALVDNFAVDATGSTEYTVQVSIDDAFSGSTLSISNFNLVFTGTAVAPEAS